MISAGTPGRLPSRARVLCAAALALVAAARDARAQTADADPRAAARVHYDTGTGAFVRGDYKSAAEEFALADRLAPTPVALSAALDAALRADLPVLGTELADRAARAPLDPALAPLVSRARARFGKRVGRVTVTCTGAPCTAKIDGSPVPLETARVVSVGQHTVTIDRAGHPDTRTVNVLPELHQNLVFESPTPMPTATPASTATPAPSPTPASTSTPTVTPAPIPPPTLSSDAAPPAGVSPVWFFAATGVSAALGGAAALSAVDTQAKHDAYLQRGCDVRFVGGCAQTKDDGQAAQGRTNTLLAVTGVAALGTAALGLFVVRWSRASAPQLAAGLVGGAPGASVRIATP